MRVKFVDNNYVRVNPLLCVIVHVIYRSIFLPQLALVEETIAYIAYLESILSASNEQVSNFTVLHACGQLSPAYESQFPM